MMAGKLSESRRLAHASFCQKYLAVLAIFTAIINAGKSVFKVLWPLFLA